MCFLKNQRKVRNSICACERRVLRYNGVGAREEAGANSFRLFSHDSSAAMESLVLNSLVLQYKFKPEKRFYSNGKNMISLAWILSCTPLPKQYALWKRRKIPLFPLDTVTCITPGLESHWDIWKFYLKRWDKGKRPSASQMQSCRWVLDSSTQGSVVLSQKKRGSQRQHHPEESHREAGEQKTHHANTKCYKPTAKRLSCSGSYKY